MAVTENYPSLINCLETGQNGLYLDLDFPSGDLDSAVLSTFSVSPFSRTISGRIKSDGDGVIQHVLLVLQRDQYDTPGSLLPVNNLSVETAWKNAFAFHHKDESVTAPIFFKHQVNPASDFKPFHSLFFCHETQHWFHPVCPQCGLALILCRDDTILEKRGLPAFSKSLERFLYCGSCATLPDSSAFYTRDKTAGMPDIVHDASALVTQWKQLLAKFPDDTDLPCRGCPNMTACYGPEALASQRIVPFSFYPFFMMMFPAPSCRAAEFIRIISGDTVAAPWDAHVTVSPSGQNRFVFQDQERQFLEILYLKLTFLSQVCHQLIPADGSAAAQDVDLSLEGIGVDLHPAGAGLPAYWNFNVRILDAVGTAQISPFATITPEAPRLHFIGAVWFHTLLVNSRQQADSVYAEVGRVLQQMDKENGVTTLEIDTSDPDGRFAGNQIFWVPDQQRLAENGQGYWKQALRLGFQLVHAGLKTGVLWDHAQFRASLDTLRNQIKDEMFSVPVTSSTDRAKSDTISMVLRQILEKWQAASATAGSQPILEAEPEPPEMDETIVLASDGIKPPYPMETGQPTATDRHLGGISGMSPGGEGWEPDIEETVIFSTADAAPSSDSTPRKVTEPHSSDSSWDDDIEETVVLRTGAAASSPKAASPIEDMDRTIVISAPSSHSEASLPGKEADLAAAMIQDGSGSSPSSFPGPDEDLEATVVLNSGRPPAAGKEASPHDDDLAATMVQGAAGPRPTAAPRPDDADALPLSDRSTAGDDPDATVIIRQASQRPTLDQSPAGADDELAATLIKTPRGDARSVKGRSPTPSMPPQPPRAVPKPDPQNASQQVAPEQASDDDDIMEQTIIIQSDLKKE